MIAKRILSGEVVPNWYGVSYEKNYGQVRICHPMPLNVLVCITVSVIREIKYFGANTHE